MSETMDQSVEITDVDRVSLKSEGKTPTKDAFKDTLGRFRSSFRHAANVPFASLRRKPKPVEASASEDPGSPSLPLSPTTGLSPGCISPVKSPPQISGSLQEKDEDGVDDDDGPQSSKAVARSKSNTAMSRLRESFRKKKKKPETNNKTDTNGGSSSEEKNEEDEDDQEVVHERMEETYTLPEIPHTPLSVMQINKLIETELLEEAHVNLLALRQEFQQEQCSKDSSVELAKKEKDLNLLYKELRNKVMAIVSESDKDVPISVARIIQEEEKRAEEPGGLAGSWMEAWREAVDKWVQQKVEHVPLDSKEQNCSWLAVHLGLLSRAIVEDLEKVKRGIQWSYPASFSVFSTYVKSYHRVVGQHLTQLAQQVTELKDLYALMDWIINTYKSERIMGSASLQPEMKDQSTDLELEENLVEQLQENYCCRLKDDVHTSLGNIIKLENTETWGKSKPPHKEDNVLDSQIHMDIWTLVKGRVVNSGNIDATLEKKVISICLDELKHFPKRFDAEFKQHCTAAEPLMTEYHISYINSFAALQEHMESYEDTCPGEVEGFRMEVKQLIVRLMEFLEEQFKEYVKPYLRRMMVRKWLTSDADFKELYSRTELLSQHCSVMRSPHAQELANRLHYHVVREYVGQLMKNNYSCKNRKHEKAAAKIRQQLDQLSREFEEMKSTEDWLCYVGDDLSNIIGQKNKTDIKEHVAPLVEHYPDFSRKHLVAVLTFRGLLRGSEHQLILQRLAELRKKLDGGAIDKSRVLFHDMQVTTNTDCLSVLPLSCLGNLLPDS